jgi:hypothetical protein
MGVERVQVSDDHFNIVVSHWITSKKNAGGADMERHMPSMPDSV